MIIFVHIKFYIVIDFLHYYNVFMSPSPPFTSNLGIVTPLAIYFDVESSWYKRLTTNQVDPYVMYRIHTRRIPDTCAMPLSIDRSVDLHDLQGLLQFVFSTTIIYTTTNRYFIIIVLNHLKSTMYIYLTF